MNEMNTVRWWEIINGWTKYTVVLETGIVWSVTQNSLRAGSFRVGGSCENSAWLKLSTLMLKMNGVVVVVVV